MKCFSFASDQIESLEALIGWVGNDVLPLSSFNLMNASSYQLAMIGCSILLMIGSALGSENSKSDIDFIRFVEAASGAKLQTAVTRFEGRSGEVVDLIGAVHIADAKYYRDLNQRFRGYEGVLYELVGGAFQPGRDQKRGGDPSKMQWIGVLQESMKNTLQLTGQLEGIDYTVPQMIHADMGISEFFGTQASKGESFLGLWAKAWRAQMNVLEEGGKSEQPGLAKILEILCRKDSAVELKRILAREFDQVERLMEGIETEGGTVIIGERNRVALEVLDAELKKGKKKIGIFYGAAHMPDMSIKLQALQFTKKTTEWLTAWDLPSPPKPSR